MDYSKLTIQRTAFTIKGTFYMKDGDDKYFEVDLVKAAHFEANPNSKQGMLIKLFSDLKRHIWDLDYWKLQEKQTK